MDLLTIDDPSFPLSAQETGQFHTVSAAHSKFIRFCHCSVLQGPGLQEEATGNKQFEKSAA